MKTTLQSLLTSIDTITSDGAAALNRARDALTHVVGHCPNRE